MKQDTFKRLEKQLGRELAFFIMCAVQDVPYEPDITVSWDTYRKKQEKDGKLFRNGETDVLKVLRNTENKEDRWQREWGYGSESSQYSEKDYMRLDELKKTMLGQLDDTGTVTAQQNDTARTCAIWGLMRDKLSVKGDKESVQTAKLYDDMIRKNLEDCNMRSKDILPSEEQRLDGFVDAIKEEYGLTLEMTTDDVLETIGAWFAKRKHPYTMDAEEHALKAILNTMRKNDDLPEYMELPDEYRMDTYGFSFEDSPDEVEDSVYRYLGIVREPRKG